LKKYLVITGGELANKGAQAMTFITVDELSRRFPGREIVLFSNIDAKRSAEEKAAYAFTILPLSQDSLFRLADWPYRLAWSILTSIRRVERSHVPLSVYEEILDNAELLVDISGFGLSSQWGILNSLRYLFAIKMAKCHGIRTILMPQSFGPFDYPTLAKPPMAAFIRSALSWPEAIFTREQEGYELLAGKLRLRNSRLAPDLVLQNRGVDIARVYKRPVEARRHEAGGEVGIVPNARALENCDPSRLYALYASIAKLALASGKNVVLLRHSREDIDACRNIKLYFAGEPRVRFLEDELSCLEFDALAGRLSCLVGSRYHAIVHAYRGGVPCLALGWATKYRELLSAFGQSSYCFDVRELDEGACLKAFSLLLESLGQERAVIGKRLEQLQSGNVFDALGPRTE
jgi:polysaccharide pyruvyl transferase WcaK-like protein